MQFKIKGIVVKTLLIILAISFVLFGIINFFTSIGQSNVLKIGDEKISLSRFTKFLNERRNQVYNSDMSDTDLDYFNSKEFVNSSLSEFISETLFHNKVKKLNIKEPNETVLEAIYKDPTFKNKNGKFDVALFKNLLNRNNMNEEIYVNYISMYNSRNNLLQLITSNDLSNKFVMQSVYLKQNKYVVADIVSINPDDLKFDYKKPTSEEISKYYEENKNEFLVSEEKVISSIEIDLSKYKNEEAKNKLSELEDLVLSSKNIDEIANKFNVNKTTFVYYNGMKNIPQGLTADILQYNTGTFSDLIYKDGNIYKIYFVEEVLPSKVLALEEATPKIVKVLNQKAKEESDLFLLDKIITQMKNNDIIKVAFRNGMGLKKNETIYKNDTRYSSKLINELFNLKAINTFTKPILDKEKNVYIIGYLKSIKEIPASDDRFTSYNIIDNKINRSFNNSVVSLFQKYLFESEKVIINNNLLNSLNN